MLRVIYGALLLASVAYQAQASEESSSLEEQEIIQAKSIESEKLENEEDLIQDEAQDRFVDLSVDVSYGLPQLGYVYNGLHLRGPKATQKKFANFVKSHNSAQGRQHFDFDTGFAEIKETFGANNQAGKNNIQVVVEETLAGENGPFVTSANEINLDNFAPTPSGLAEVSTLSLTEADKYNFPPYTAPASVSPPELVRKPNKPPIHIKLQKDIQGLVGTMTAMLKNVKSKEGGSSSPLNFNFPTNMPTLPIPQAPGKPPLLEKIRQDFFSWLPTGDKETSSAYGAPPVSSYETPSYTAPSVGYETPEPVYNEPAYYHPPIQSGSVNTKQGQREPMLTKFYKDITKVNKWLGKQAVSIMENGPPALPFELPNLPELPEVNSIQRVQKRMDNVMKYISAPKLGQNKH